MDTVHIACNPETGLCETPTFSKETTLNSDHIDGNIIYIGDPMCSWCWGISPQINALKHFCDQNNMSFTLLMGGLRPGGGDPWNDEFKAFLKHHWAEVNERSGQPFGYDLFDLDAFNYDTEPASRSVVTIKHLAPEKVLAFYEWVQHFFYVKSQDPKIIDFYRPICKTLDIDFEAFSKSFPSDEMKTNTYNDFRKSRALGISGFPSVVYQKNNKNFVIARGYTKFEDLKLRINVINQN